MPFESHAHEAWMKHNKPSIWRRWKAKYGSYKGSVVRKAAAKLARK